MLYPMFHLPKTWFESMFVLKEMSDYIPKEPQFDFYLQDNEQNVFFKLEILDKSNNDIVTQKKLSLSRYKLRPHMINRPPRIDS